MPPMFGQKVVLKGFCESDITDVYIGWLNDSATMRFSNQRFSRHDKASSQLYLATFSKSVNLFLSVSDRATGSVIGTMTAYVSQVHGTADMGILIGERSAQAHGFGFDAWTTLLQHLLAQPNIRKVTAGTLACNTPMLRLAAKSGMAPDGRRNLQEVVDGVPHDMLFFAKFSGV